MGSKNMSKKYVIKKFILDCHGEGIITGLYTMLILTIIFFIGIDIAGYTSTSWKLRNACSETLTLMKIENGFDSNTERIFLNYAEIQGLDTSSISVKGTQKTTQRGDVVTINADIPYVIRSLRPFNNELSVNISVEMWGLAQEYIKNK